MLSGWLGLTQADYGWLRPICALVSVICFGLVWCVFPGLAGVA